jgi:hypothetical protein
MIDGLDTIAYYFSQRLQTVNPARQYMGYMDAQQWPQKTVVFNAFYVLVLGDKPKLGESIAVPIYDDLLQFVWVNKGTDVNNYNSVIGANRGDRLRTSSAMKEELIKALWPFFTQKVHLTPQADGSVTAATLNEPVYWSKPDFRIRSDRESGIDYGIATVHLIDMTETITN